MKNLLALASLFLFGCGTIINGSTQQVTLDSSPVGIEARIDGQQTIITPAVVELTRKNSHLIVFYHPGYQDQSVTFVPNVSGWVFGNIIFGPLFGIVGVLVDNSNGGMYVLSQDSASVALLPVNKLGLSFPKDHYLPPHPVLLTCWKGDAKVSCP